MDNSINFLEELHTLLLKYEAEIMAADHYQGYPECGQDIRMTVEFKDWNNKSISLGNWIDGSSNVK